MLSKAQARAFFVVGTGACALAFIGLTIDTFAQIPKQTQAAEITAEVAHGKELWESNNCMGCHTLFGEGAYYAPELTKVYERRGEFFIRAMLVDPERMFPGERKMQRFDFTLDEINALIAFLKWAGTVDLNGFPAEPVLAGRAVPANDDRPKVFAQVCVACHTLDGQGGAVGPALDGVGSRRDATYLSNWLHNPAVVKADARMPKLPLSDEEIDQLVAFLGEQKE